MARKNKETKLPEEVVEVEEVVDPIEPPAPEPDTDPEDGTEDGEDAGTNPVAKRGGSYSDGVVFSPSNIKVTVIPDVDTVLNMTVGRTSLVMTTNTGALYVPVKLGVLSSTLQQALADGFYVEISAA